MIEIFTFEELAQLGEVFERKKWSGDINEFDGDVFNKTVDLLSELDQRQRKLVLSFIENYYRLTDYADHCRAIARQITSKFGRRDKILFLPVSDAEPKVKSGHSVCYEIQRFLDDRLFLEVDTLDHYDRLNHQKVGSKLVIVDDFVGSGSQMRKMLRTIINSFPEMVQNISIYVICMQRIAYNRVRKLCPNVYACEIRDRAITDAFAIGSMTAQEALEVYQTIESRLSMRVWYKLGYGRAEALVSMKRTPNNTLPIFWNDRQKGGTKWPAPFLRIQS
ncbi:phosphoribosyltransferase domain-containing protein [Methylobacterium sp. NMS14P]|uniref:phosphoribosyltransferase-like protein n=1 Tax=Methylobacterium sp. NMS14P TaxID=2894310 RepID=UPI002359C88D|nr:phosphoribosyltransferase family protein [Methylobacterium sp. NMS14P]WCS25715.1 phosphoribosyltransferase domain-containing protein [Methylobacterium sp. NMS14P]